jgi:hypothetical protein
MSIRDARPYNDYRRKANQQWDLAGLARQDGDKKAEAEHTEKAREYDQLANDMGDTK